MMLLFSVLSLSSFASNCINDHGESGPCQPGREYCGQPFAVVPQFHLVDQHGCGENDPNGPVFDPVHGVIHHFYQIHLAAPPGHGPDYGHFVSKDFVHWAPMPVAIWNGLDSSFSPPKVTKNDNEAIFTGSAVVVDGAGPGGKGPGVINIYPGLCNKNDWPSCKTGTLLAQAVPADYLNDQLLTNWTKPSYNPIIENTQRDPSTPWKTPSGEWRLRTYNSMVYGAASDADLLAGKWYTIGVSKDFRTCECPSFYPLPALTPGFEAMNTTLPTHVHKTSCGGDWWQLGTYTPGKPKELGSFQATPGWEPEFAQRKIDMGNFYASKDNEYPTKSGGKRRINWGWATVPPASTQTLPREITFNPMARQLQQYPIQEVDSLRGAQTVGYYNLSPKSIQTIKIDSPKTSDIIAVFTLPKSKSTFGIKIGDGSSSSGVDVKTMMPGTDLAGDDYNITHYPANSDPKRCQDACNADSKCKAWTYVIRGSPAGSGDCCLKSGITCPQKLSSCTSGAKTETTLNNCGVSSSMTCSISFSPPSSNADFYNVDVSCGSVRDTLRLLPTEKTVEIRVLTDITFVEAFFQRGRTAMTAKVSSSFPEDTKLSLVVTDGSESIAVKVNAWPMETIWVTPDDVRKAPRVYN